MNWTGSIENPPTLYWIEKKWTKSEYNDESRETRYILQTIHKIFSIVSIKARWMLTIRDGQHE